MSGYFDQNPLIQPSASKFDGFERRLGYLLWTANLILIGFVIVFKGNEYLSQPPSESKESRQYTECKEEQANKSTCLGSVINITEPEDSKDSSDHAGNAQEKEYSPNVFIKDKRDLNAQEGMWRATNFLGYLTIIQIFIGAITVIVVWLTLRQTSKATEAAAGATEAATKSILVSQQAIEIELQPYLRIDFVRCWKHVKSPAIQIIVGNPDDATPSAPIPPELLEGSRGIEVEIKITNEGKSPATDIFIDCDGERSVITYGSEVFDSESYCSSDPRPSDSQSSIIPAGGHMSARLYFPEKMIFARSDTAKFFDSKEGEFILEYLSLKDIQIRYKDFVCKGTRSHKLILASLTYVERHRKFGLEPTEIEIGWYRVCKDSKHHHYQDYKPIINQ